MQWSGLEEGKAAVIGLVFEATFYQNHAASGFAAVADIVSCGVSQERRRKRQTRRMTRNRIMKAGTGLQTENRVDTCIDRFNRDVTTMIIKPTDLANLVSDVPCPPNLQQAVLDVARYSLYTKSPFCYVSALPKKSEDVSNAGAVSVTQQCCYEDNG